MSHTAPITAETARRQSKRAQKFLQEKGFDVSLALIQEMTASQWGFRTFQGLIGSCQGDEVSTVVAGPSGMTYADRWMVTEDNLEEFKRHPVFIFDTHPVVAGCECWEFPFDRGLRFGSVTLWPDGKAAIWFGDPTPVNYGRWDAATETVRLPNGMVYHVDGRPDASLVQAEVNWSADHLGIEDDEIETFKALFLAAMDSQFVELSCTFEPNAMSSHGVSDLDFHNQPCSMVKDQVYYALSKTCRDILHGENLKKAQRDGVPQSFIVTRGGHVVQTNPLATPGPAEDMVVLSIYGAEGSTEDTKNLLEATCPQPFGKDKAMFEAHNYAFMMNALVE